MEFYNPINDMKDIIGTWEGEIKKDDKVYTSSIVFKYHGSDIIQYKQRVKKGKEEKISETGFFFFDKLKEELKHLVINDEGYIEINSLNCSNKTKLLNMTSMFNSGYNLPPNIKIKREFTLKRKERELDVILKMGREAKIISEANYFKIKKNF